MHCALWNEANLEHTVKILVSLLRRSLEVSFFLTTYCGACHLLNAKVLAQLCSCVLEIDTRNYRTGA